MHSASTSLLLPAVAGGDGFEAEEDEEDEGPAGSGECDDVSAAEGGDWLADDAGAPAVGVLAMCALACECRQGQTL